MAKVELKAWSTSEVQEFHQKCMISVDTFRELGADIGSFIEIETNGAVCICSVWLKEDLETCSLVYNNIVYGSEIDTFCNRSEIGKQCCHGDKDPGDNIGSSRAELQTEHSNKITVLNTVMAAELGIEVVLYKLENVSEYKRSEVLLKQLQIYCGNLLSRICLKPKFIINCTASRLARKYGISYIIVKYVKSVNCVKHTCNTGYIVNKLTSIKVATVHSVEWFEQMSLPKISVKRPGGLDNVIHMLLELIKLPLEQKDKFKLLGAQPPRGVLLCGPPGCGKTSLVKYICGVNSIYLVTVNGPEIFGPRPGETESNLRQVFRRVKLMSEEGPCILFIDEIDSLCSSRGGAIHEARTTAQFLSLMDSLTEEDDILVIGATNRPSALDIAVRRPGRLDREVLLNPPTCLQRLEILTTLVKDIPVSNDLDLENLGEMTNGYVGADLASLCHEAAYLAMSESADGNLKMISQCHFLSAFKKIRPSLQKGAEGVVDLRPVYWSDIGGLDTVKKQIKQAVEWPLKHPEAFKRMGLKPPRGVLLYGPPGCCKTTLVRAAATACHSTFLCLSGAQLYSPYVGDSEKLVTEVFQKARACAPSILFLDELDSIVGKRSESGHRGVQERILSTLLNEMDGIGVRLGDGSSSSHHQKTLEGDHMSGDTGGEIKTVDNRSVLVVAATNRPDLIDDALMRPGRMDRVIYVPQPDVQARKDIFQLYSKSMLLPDSDLDLLAERTDLYTGADIESVCREAALFALTEDIETSTVTMEQFEKALKVVPPSLNTELIQKYSQVNVS